MQGECIYGYLRLHNLKISKHLNVGLCFLLLYRLLAHESKMLQEQAYEFVVLHKWNSAVSEHLPLKCLPAR